LTERKTNQSVSIFDGLARQIVTASKRPGAASPASRNAYMEILALEQEDYGRPLRRSLGRSEVREIIAEAKSAVWPRLNDESVKLVSPTEFTRLWSGLGVQFQLAKLGGAEGLALLGFYVREMGGSRLPLICVNTAHHPAAIGATFSHEMGHHLVSRLFDSHEDHAQLLTYTAYGEHLDEPEELAADILVSLGVFPEAMARNIFLKPVNGKQSKVAAVELPDSVSTKVLKYFEGRFGLSFGAPLPVSKRLQYLAAVVHFSKLRRALLTEYDI
jgi:hypothetical protein